MTPALTARVLRLPESVRATLATVEGPGCWIVATPETRVSVPDPICVADGEAWWPANPAWSVAAVTSMPSWWAHQRIADWLYDREPDADDHAAALSIIEAHVARSTA